MFKYSEQISIIEGQNTGACTSNLSSFNDISYRWVFGDNRPENFLPRALIDHPKIINTKKQCNGWSLSMFDSEDNAYIRLTSLCIDKPQLFKRLGTHIAEIELNDTDGLISNIGHDGHFDLFEYEGCNLQDKCTIVLNVEQEYVK